MVGLTAFVCYHATLLPGLDFGDTASFQTGVGAWLLTPRQAYPLYFGLGNIFVWLDPGEPAHALNFASAVYGALAASIATWVAAELAASTLAGLASGLFLAFSYTFWTQAIIAEVYTLHLLLFGISLATLLAWSRKPTLTRLAVFYAVYALGFGNHLSMVLLLPGFTLFILLCRVHGPHDPLRPKAIAMAIGIAALGSLQYLWNFRGMWIVDPVPATFREGVWKFWFDVTKSDWRESLVATVSAAGLQNRPAMYSFDIHQQFGAIGIALAAVGFAFLGWKSWRAAVLLGLLYLSNLIFAWNYNVGDVHVFFLPSHYVVALCAGAGVAALARASSNLPRPPQGRAAIIGRAVSILCLAYVIWRGYDTFPAVDRSWDRRPERLLDDFATRSLWPEDVPLLARAVFGVEENWQIQNALEYYERQLHPGFTWFTPVDLDWLSTREANRRVERIIHANLDAGRPVIVTPLLRARLQSLGHPEGWGDISAFGPVGDPLLQIHDSAGFYALGILRPTREYAMDIGRLDDLLSFLTGGRVRRSQIRDYTVIVGETGKPPLLFEAQDLPYRRRVRAGSVDVDVRMESWLLTDTIRRAGFGHVIVGRRHVLTLERGISFVAFDAYDHNGRPIYEAGIFAPIPRLFVRPPGRHF